MMRETKAIGEALGVRFRVRLEKRIAGAEAVGPHKTSMLQDVETGRALEADALVGSVIELGRIVDVASPHLEFARCGRQVFLEKRWPAKRAALSSNRPEPAYHLENRHE